MSVAKLRLVSGGPVRAPKFVRHKPAGPQLTHVQENWLVRGLGQPGGKLPLFDESGKRIHPRTIHRCIESGWIEPWFANPVKPDWQICKLTEAGRRMLGHA